MAMESLEQWIWLPASQYPDKQTTVLSCLSSEDQNGRGNYSVVRFSKECRYQKAIQSVSIRTSGDTFFRLHINGRHCVTGPASVGGDFLGNDMPRPQYYATEVTLGEEEPGFLEGRLDISARVRMQSLRMFEYSMGHGGFFLTAQIRFCDGTKTILCTDESWMAQVISAESAPKTYDGTLQPQDAVHAERIPNRWHCLTSPIPTATETTLIPEGNPILIPAGEEITISLSLPMIYTGYLKVCAKTSGRLSAVIFCRETETERDRSSESVIFNKDDEYLSTVLCSAGKIRVQANNEGSEDAEMTVAFVCSHYPVTECAHTDTDDPALNRVLEVCTHTLKYCRQTLHLDSGSHCEPLACTGDYYIEALMTAMTFGDMRLSEFDIRRTAQLLRYNNGRMFHTTYSLIWVLMLRDVYQYTGNMALLLDCEEALILLLERFSAYIGDNGLIEVPPDYMFIDWLIPDGISTHHPPKALGQTCLNLFYYGALSAAEYIYGVLNEKAMAERCGESAKCLSDSIREHLYDPVRGLFFEGLNTPTPEKCLGQWMPQNVDKRYYRKHANILAAYFGILPLSDCQAILHKVMTEQDLGEIQPYFCHFLLEAVYRCGLRDTYTLSILEQWKAPVEDCPYGLAEGFHKPEPTYSFDHSHAWGGTPAYSLPLALSGIEILEPGYRSIRLNPSLLGLKEATVEIPTPYGMLLIKQRENAAPTITIPDGITLI